MYKTKLLSIAIMAMFLACVSSNATGQTRIPITASLTSEPRQSIDSTKVSGVEISPGETSYAVSTTYGATYVGQTIGALTGSFFMSVNYTLPGVRPMDVQAANSAAGRPQPIDQSSEVSGGSWTREIYRDGKYLGSVYGRITGGTVVWSQTDLTATLKLSLVIDNGTGAFVDRTGKGEFLGALDRMGKVATISGGLNLVY
jgi:hypothetical protein